MQKKKYVPIFAAAAAFVILLAAGTAAFIKSHGTAHARTALPVAAAEPDGAEEWMYLQRANADGSIPDDAVNAAIAQSKAAGKASKGSPSTDQVWTELGPSNIGGRVRDAAADPTTQDVVYVATGSGGLWRSSDGGATLTSAWDNYLPQSMGAVAVDSRGVVWAGTGEPDHGGGSAYYGKGIYKSTDHGATWTNMGLEDGDTIGQIVIDPRDDDRVFVAVMGALHDTEPTRGLFMTEDGGATWTRVIVPQSTSTGAIDVAIDNSNPDVMLATTWDKIRDEKSRIYGPHSYVYRSTDGGHTWTNVQNAPLPQSETDPALQTPDNLVGRMGVAFSDSDPNRAYLISSTARGNFNGFFTSTDAGATWTAVGPTSGGTLQNISGGFAWWFGGVYVDPVDPLHVFLDGVNLAESVNGGAHLDDVKRRARRPARRPLGSPHARQGVPRQRRRLLPVAGERAGPRAVDEDGAPADNAVLCDGRVRPGRRARRRRFAGQRLGEVVGQRQHRQRRLVRLRRRRRDDEPDQPDQRPPLLRLLAERRLPWLRGRDPELQHAYPGQPRQLGRADRVRRRPAHHVRGQRVRVSDEHGCRSTNVGADQPRHHRGHRAARSRLRKRHGVGHDAGRSESLVRRHRQRSCLGQPQRHGGSGGR